MLLLQLLETSSGILGAFVCLPRVACDGAAFAGGGGTWGMTTYIAQHAMQQEPVSWQVWTTRVGTHATAMLATRAGAATAAPHTCNYCIGSPGAIPRGVAKVVKHVHFPFWSVPPWPQPLCTHSKHRLSKWCGLSGPAFFDVSKRPSGSMHTQRWC